MPTTYRFFARYEIPVLLLSIFIISFAVLTFEISLTRMFSVMFAYHYAFLAVAIAFAGLGLGAMVGHLIFSNVNREELFGSLAITYSLFSFLISFFTILMVSSSTPNVFSASTLYFLSFLPSGAFLATVYEFYAKYSNLVYGADIVGASLGSFAVVTFLNGLSPLTTIFIVCSLLLITSILLAFLSSKKKTVSAVIIFVLMVASIQLSVNKSTIDIPLGGEQGKELYGLLKNNPAARIVESRWSAFGRTDLVEIQNSSDYMIIFIDGGAGTLMYRFDSNFTNPESIVYKLRFSTIAYPFYFAKKQSALVIGPGGGVDVLVALMFNISHIYAVEVNGDTVSIVRDYSDFNGGIYTDYDSVHVFVDEGRSFLKRSGTKYDVIMLNIPITKTVQGTTGYAMAENYLFTADSFKDYINHLGDDGYLVIRAHDILEIYKLVATITEAMKSEGKSTQDIMSHIAVVEEKHHHMSFPVLILSKIPFAQVESMEMLEKARELNLKPVYFPYANSTVKEVLDTILVALADGKITLNSLIGTALDQGLDLTPSTDDRPFFYKFESGLPSTLPSLLIGFSLLSVLVIIIYILMWEGRLVQSRSPRMRKLVAEKFSIFMPFYFACLGLGFMLIEISFVQKFILFLGPPTVAISAVLFSLLLSMGIGNLLSKRLSNPANLVWKPSLLCGIITVLYSFSSPFIFSNFLGFDMPSRLLISFLLLFPVGFLLGIPFPTGINIMNQFFDSKDITWMWGINSIFSLLGSTLAVVFAMMFGFTTVALLGSVMYFIIFWIGRAYVKNKILELKEL